MKIGMIGCGNMGKAMLRGMLGCAQVKPEDVMVSARTQETLRFAREQLGVGTGSNVQTAAFADVLFLAVKPQFLEDIMDDVKENLKEEAILCSIAPGKTLAYLMERTDHAKVVRAMPNTPALVGEGMTGICLSDQVGEEERQLVCRLFESFGKVEVVPERLMDVVTGVSGSSPAYVFMVIEALADGAVAEGMPRAAAYRFAAQAVLGSARLVLESGKHPGELKDMVCSPGGTTIEAVALLEKYGLRSALIEAERACIRKSKGM